MKNRLSTLVQIYEFVIRSSHVSIGIYIMQKPAECDTLRRGEISERKGNIKRCCWHRLDHSLEFYFTVRLAPAAVAEAEKKS